MILDDLVVFDTSALCELYRLVPTTRDEVLKILSYMKTQIFLPHRVWMEFERHYKEMPGKKIKEHYSKPYFLKLGYIKELREYLKQLEEPKGFHPYFDDIYMRKLNNHQRVVEHSMDRIRQLVMGGIEARTKEIKEFAENDTIHDTIEGLNRGVAYPYNELRNLICEGHIRYQHSIPPGYMDAKDKSSIDRFGDLIIWKQLMDAAHSKQKNVIFVINDVKEDWIVSKKKERLEAREELYDEFAAVTGGKMIEFYTLEQFVRLLPIYFSSDKDLDWVSSLGTIADELMYLNDVREKFHAGLSDNFMEVRCKNCKSRVVYSANDLSFEWESEYTDYDRAMGTEVQYVSYAKMKCPECGELHSFDFEVWEYPIGVVNSQSIYCEGCYAIHEIRLADQITLSALQCCAHCGRWVSELSSFDMCEECQDEFDWHIEID